MRKALNDNPVAQIAVLGALAVVVAFFLLTRVMHKSNGTATPTSTTPSATTAPGSSGATTTPGATAPTATTPAPSTSTPAAPDGTTTSPAPPVDVPTGRLVAGPGLPAGVVNAYKADKAVVLLVVRHGGIDDRELFKSVVAGLPRGTDMAMFTTNAAHISKYARITEGVQVNRVPALVVIRPRHLSHGTPSALVSYGFRGPDSVQQAVRNALYKGPTNLPYYPK